MTTQQNISVNDFIQQLEASRETIEVLVPSHEEPLEMYTMTTKQQKELLVTILSDEITNKGFYEVANKIIIENIQKAPEGFEPSDINIYDRDAILLQLRINSIGSTFASKLDKNSDKIDLGGIEIKHKTFNIHILEEDNLKITLSLPSILDDELFNRYLEFDINVEDNELILEALDAVYLRLAEHIVSIEKVDVNRIFNCRQDPPATMELISNLPNKVFSKIFATIQEDYITPYNELLTFQDTHIEMRDLFAIDLPTN